MAATNRDLAQARAAQQAARVAAQADMARLEAQEFHRIVEENRHSEQQQLEKVSTCAPECIMCTFTCVYSIIYTYTCVYHTHVSGIIYTYTCVNSIIVVCWEYVSVTCRLLGMPHVASEPCWECMLVMGALWVLIQATSVHVANMWRNIPHTSVNISTC